MIQLDWDMPTSCQECRFAVDGWCYALRANDGQPSELCYLTRPEWCPLRDAASAIEELQAEVKRLNLRCADCEYGNSEWPEDPGHTKMEVGI